MKRMRIGTYHNEIHQRRTQLFLDKVFQAYPAFKVPGAIEIIEISPPEDKKRDNIAGEFGLRNIYAREIEAALLSGDIDMAVHGIRDLPPVLQEGYEVACLLPRNVPWDCLTVKTGSSIRDISECTSVGVLSPYHADWVRSVNSAVNVDILVPDMDSLVKQRDELPHDGIVLPLDDLRLLDAQCRIAAVLDDGYPIPLSGQGGIGVEILSKNVQAKDFLTQISCRETEKVLACENMCMGQLPDFLRPHCAVYAFYSDSNTLNVHALTFDPMGQKSHFEESHDMSENFLELGTRVGQQLAAHFD